MLSHFHLHDILKLSPQFLLMGCSSTTHLLKSPTPPLAAPLAQLSWGLRGGDPFVGRVRFRPFMALRTSRGYSSSPQRLAPARPVIKEAPLYTEAPLNTGQISVKLSLLMKKLEKYGISGHEEATGQYDHLLCPLCEGGRSSEKSLSVHIAPDANSAMWLCYRGTCGWTGRVMSFADIKPTTSTLNQTAKEKKRVLTEEELDLQPLCDQIHGYFAERMISRETVARNAIRQRAYGDKVVIAFTYRRNGALVSCKYRTSEKKFWQEPDTEKIFYGLDDIKNATDIIIVSTLPMDSLNSVLEFRSYGTPQVEGEMDKLAMEEAGFRNCISVPDGAPATVSDKDLPPPEKDKKYQYLWNCEEYLEKASRIIIATDGDPPGQALAEELARRLGRERCWRVKWPKKNDAFFCKDANDVLMHLGRAALKDVIDSAELYPLRGLFGFKDYFREIDEYYHTVIGDELGRSTGWRCLDEFYNVVPGELTIVTGVPNSGKSEWIDALMCNLNENFGWKFALCSMENKVREHARKLLEKHLKKPFFSVRYGESMERITLEELERGKEWLSDTFFLIRCEDDCLPNISWVLNLARAAVLRHGVKGLVIDPYNELDHQRPSNMTETEYVSQMLTVVKRFAQHHSCHVWFVAHPRQLHSWAGGPPNLYDISGSAHFINKCDNGIVVHRNRDPDAGPMDRVQICVRKVRNKVAGQIGDAFLTYNRTTGEFKDSVISR
ncbi:Twinkle homolog protein, chloroplastic/mitochondrial-like protein [Drosera capensis]